MCIIAFGLLLKYPYITTIFATSRKVQKKVLDQSDKNKKCLSVGNFGILSVVICSASTAYTSLCRGWKYLLKMPYFIKYYLSVAGFSIFETLCLSRLKNSPISEKISQKWTEFVFGNTYLEKKFIECMSNQYAHFNISICHM